jgi:hypothetical protein
MMLLCGSETWALTENKWKNLQTEEMKYLASVEFCNGTDKLKNEERKTELVVSTLQEKSWKIEKTCEIFRTDELSLLNTFLFEKLISPELVMKSQIERMNKSRTYYSL